MAVSTLNKKGIADYCLEFILFIIITITIYPFIYVVSSSFSDVEAISKNQVWLFPVNFSLDSYEKVFQTPQIFQAYYNSIWYSGIGSVINIVMALLAAYPLSRKEFTFRKSVTKIIAFTMFFSGGLVPSFVLVTELGLYNTRWAIVLPLATSAWYIIITKVYLQSTIPDSLIESARIEGYNEGGILLRIVFPLSKSIVAVIGLFSAIYFWNDYFSILLFVPNQQLHPLTLLLRRILLMGQIRDLLEGVGGMDPETIYKRMLFADQFKYAMIVITILPIMLVYPFVQKYFAKGIMIGSIKE